MQRELNLIETCFIRENKKCERVLNGSKTAFIATPASDYVQLELDIIKSKLQSYQVEPYVAVEHRAFGRDVFCEKICGKIIESLFCIVLLNDREENIGGKLTPIPNANVYYEYGLMTSLHKRIIPLQKKDHKLAFNIQSLDTIKYTQKDFSSEIENAIREIFLEDERTENKKFEGTIPKELTVYLGLNGISWPTLTKGSDFETAALTGGGIGFIYMFDFIKYQSCYLKILENDEDEKETNILISAVIKRLEGLGRNIFRHLDVAEGAEYKNGKREINKEKLVTPEAKDTIRMIRQSLQIVYNPKFIIFRNRFNSKKSIILDKKDSQGAPVTCEIVVLDRSDIACFIELQSS